MQFFNGNYTNSLDEKGRVAVPAKLRRLIEDNEVTVTRGLDPCLYVYPTQAWGEQLEKLMKLPQSNPQARRLRTFIVGSADTVELDKQGRINLNAGFIDFLSLDREASETKVVVVGDINRILIWNPTVYQDYMKSTENDIPLLSEEFAFEF